jgi:hypothetical protein
MMINCLNLSVLINGIISHLTNLTFFGKIGPTNVLAFAERSRGYEHLRCPEHSRGSEHYGVLNFRSLR